MAVKLDIINNDIKPSRKLFVLLNIMLYHLKKFVSVAALFCLFVMIMSLQFYGANYYKSLCPTQMTWKEQQDAELASHLKLMQERLDRIQLTCREHNDDMNRAYREFFGEDINKTAAPLYIKDDYLVERQLKIGWCKIPKTASTSMVHSLLRILGREDVLTTTIRARLHTELRTLMPPPEPQEILPDLNSFMIVRHPFDRILSAYRDKIANKNDTEAKRMFPKFLAEYNLPIIQKYRKSAPSSSFYSNVPTFPEFVDYLLDTSQAQYNEHWKPYFLICLPCHVKYTVALTLETMENDYRVLVERTGFPELKPAFTHSTVVTDPQLNQTYAKGGRVNYTEEYFSQIPKWKLMKLSEKYLIDFEMFGYDARPFYEITKS